MRSVVLGFHETSALARAVARLRGFPWAAVEAGRFPDGELRLRLPADVEGSHVVLVASLFPADAALLEVVFAAETARRLGAVGVTLVAPYLAYMRQEAEFRPGEAVSARVVADLLSPRLDRLVTVDPHLHRFRSLDEVYRCRTTVLCAAAPIGDFIAGQVDNPLIVGPDAESEQWVARVAGPRRLPRLVLSKTRRGPTEVEVAAAAEPALAGATAVIVDDIISTAHTMVEAVRRVRERGARRVVCVGVHALFVEDAYRRLLDAGADEVVTCDSIPHFTNRISLAPLLAEAL